MAESAKTRREPDDILLEIADYVLDYEVDSKEAYTTARYCLMDTIGCGLLSLRYPECVKLLGPTVPGMTVRGGARVPGTQFELDPVAAAFNIGVMNRWLDYNDAWLAAEWGHPSDNLGGILAVADYLSRKRTAEVGEPLTVRDVLTAMIKAHEVQGILALENSFNRLGLDHVLLVKVASTAVVAGMLGGTREEIVNALSNAFIDGGALRAYRHAPNAGPRKSWAAGDATSRAVWLAMMARRGEMGYPTALSAERWGFQDVLFGGKPVALARPLGSYVMENVLFKVSFPAEFHGQTAVEAALRLHEDVEGRLEEVERVTIKTQEPAIRIIDKTGPLHNPADRDHCLQYMVAVSLVFGGLTADHYEDDVAADSRIDALREKMQVVEDERYTKEYYEPGKRAIANAVKVHFADGSTTDKVEVEYPKGHRRRRREGFPLLERKFAHNCRTRLPEGRVQQIEELFSEEERLLQTPVSEFMEMFLI